MKAGLDDLGLPEGMWHPHAVDDYRHVLSLADIKGILSVLLSQDFQYSLTPSQSRQFPKKKRNARSITRRSAIWGELEKSALLWGAAPAGDTLCPAVHAGPVQHSARRPSETALHRGGTHVYISS